MAGGDPGSGERVLEAPFAAAHQGATLALFGATLLLGAFLLFWVQPLFTRMVLPMLGGSPAVWNTAMVFFQGALLAGYAYAHAIGRWLEPRRQMLVHLALLAAASLTLPIAVGEGWVPPTEGWPVLWLIALLGWSVGVPFIAVSATAPLLQRWFATSGHPAGGDPYFLYGASNTGSILALLGYPFLLEPARTLDEQSRLWALGFGALALLVVACGLTARRATAPDATAASEGSVGLGWRCRLRWLVLALVPSALLLAVTAHISTDLAAVPLLWVVPLSLYLLTFVIVFARRPALRHAWMVRAQPFLIIPLALLFTWNSVFWISVPLHLATFFVSAMVCHGELARLRPVPERLTDFYLWMALGGMLGGLLAAVLAPLLFDSVLEYPLAIAAACLLRPAAEGRSRRLLDPVLPIAVMLLILLWGYRRALGLPEIGGAAMLLVMVPAALLLYATASRPLRFGLGIAGALAAVLLSAGQHEVLSRDRSFFGIYTVKHDPAGYHVLVHGTTVHGAQAVERHNRRAPLTYFHRAGPLGQMLAALDEGRIRTVGAVGLGAGTVACYRRPGQRWIFFEIDPLVERIARDTRLFHYLADCAPDAEVVLGDARIGLQGMPAARFDLLILDAFSSDAIPIHLLTREALRLYLDRLSERGVIALHVSNRNLDLAPIVADLAADAGVVALVQTHSPPAESQRAYRNTATWVAIARRPEDLGDLAADSRWRRLEAGPDARPWRDDFADIVSALRWRWPF
jgi:hypothetical protein